MKDVTSPENPGRDKELSYFSELCAPGEQWNDFTIQFIFILLAPMWQNIWNENKLGQCKVLQYSFKTWTSLGKTSFCITDLAAEDSSRPCGWKSYPFHRSGKKQETMKICAQIFLCFESGSSPRYFKNAQRLTVGEKPTDQEKNIVTGSVLVLVAWISGHWRAKDRKRGQEESDRRDSWGGGREGASKDRWRDTHTHTQTRAALTRKMTKAA